VHAAITVECEGEPRCRYPDKPRGLAGGGAAGEVDAGAKDVLSFFYTAPARRADAEQTFGFRGVATACCHFSFRAL
jgi:hypothetical protein